MSGPSIVAKQYIDPEKDSVCWGGQRALENDDIGAAWINEEEMIGKGGNRPYEPSQVVLG